MDFHLLVRSACKLQGSVTAPPGSIAGFIHALTRFGAERIGHKLFRRKRGTIQIAARQSGACDAKLSLRSSRHWLTVEIQRIDRGVRNGTSDGNTAAMRRRRADMECRLDRAFRWSIGVIQLRLQHFQGLTFEVRRQHLSSADDLPQCAAMPDFRMLKQGAQQGGRQIDESDLSGFHDIHEIIDIILRAWSGDNHLSSRGQRAKDFSYRGVETNRSFVNDSIGTGQAEGGLHPLDLVGNRGVTSYYPLASA